MWLTEEANVNAIEVSQESAAKPQVNADLRNEARLLHHSSQLRRDFFEADHCLGFNNPVEVLKIFTSTVDLARQTQIKAKLAAMP